MDLEGRLIAAERRLRRRPRGHRRVPGQTGAQLRLEGVLLGGERAGSHLAGVLRCGAAQFAAHIAEPLDELGGLARWSYRPCPARPAPGHRSWVPAPIPTVGMVSLPVIWVASSAGTISITTATAPASATAIASWTVCSAASPRPCTRKPPRPLTLCGVKPMWAITGMPACVSTAICSATRSPPSSFTACAPASFMNRVAVARACVRAGLVAAERQVGHHQRVRRTAHHAAHQRDQLVDRDRHGGVVAVHHVGGGVADQQYRDPGVVEHPRGGVVVGGEHGPLVALGSSTAAGGGCAPWCAVWPNRWQRRRHELSFAEDIIVPSLVGSILEALIGSPGSSDLSSLPSRRGKVNTRLSGLPHTRAMPRHTIGGHATAQRPRRQLPLPRDRRPTACTCARSWNWTPRRSRAATASTGCATNLAVRIKAMPEFREKLADSPFNLDHPVWVEDNDFDVDRHLHRIGLPAPGGRTELVRDLRAHRVAAAGPQPAAVGDVGDRGRRGTDAHAGGRHGGDDQGAPRRGRRRDRRQPDVAAVQHRSPTRRRRTPVEGLRRRQPTGDRGPRAGPVRHPAGASGHQGAARRP